MTFPNWFFPKAIRFEDGGRYRHLDAQNILATIDKLEMRVADRFPDSGLRRVVLEFRALSEQSARLAERLGRAILPVRILVGLAVVAMFFLIWQVMSLFLSRLSPDVVWRVSELVQASESFINELIFIGLALYFLTSVETRLKRQAALRALHQLRSIAHVVDMHQLTKDPAYLLGSKKMAVEHATAASPDREYTTFELSRYLDYCTEMLSLIAKTAALFAQTMDDPVLLEAVNDVESLCQGMAGKIWQKIMILDLAVERAR